MAIYYTVDCATEDFIHWYGKCKHYGITPEEVIAAVIKDLEWTYDEEDDTEKKE